MENQNPQQALSTLPSYLKTADWYNSFLVRVAQGVVTKDEMDIDPVTARMNSVAVNKMLTGQTKIALAKIIDMNFAYFGAEASLDMVRTTIDDIMDMYGWMSPLEIVKAITEGRRKQEKIYGKFSGKNIMDWLDAYNQKLDSELARHHQNKKHVTNPEVEALIDKALHYQSQIIEKKRELTHDEKVEALKERYEPISEAEQARRKHFWAWNFEEYGDLKAYMDIYDESIKNQKDKANDSE